MTLLASALPLLQHLLRGGTYGNWWNGTTKTTIWWEVGTPADLPAGGHNLYFGVHPTTAIPPKNAKGEVSEPANVRSQLAYIAAINCLFAEYDAKHFDGGKAAALAHIDALPKAPTVVIDSGGGYHCYWLLATPFLLSTDDDRARAARLQKAWVKCVGSDDDAKDLARVLRVPGTRNYKKDYAPTYPAVDVVRADYTRLYDLAELEALLPVAPAQQPRRTCRRAASPDANNQDETGSIVDLGIIATVAEQLKRLSTERRDQYNGWLQVGMALRGLGAIGFELWELWSKDSGKYQSGICADKWQTFIPDTGITLASLGYWADIDDPPQPTSDPAPTPETDRLRRENAEFKQWATWTHNVLQSELGAPEKVTLLGVKPQLDAGRILSQRTRPSTPLPINYDHVSAMTNQSSSTISRTVRKLEAAQVWQCAPEHAIHPEGFTYDKMRLIPLPAFDDPTQIQPIPPANTHGGKRDGAGRKPKCTNCPPGTPILEKRTRTRQTTIRFCCQGCGEILDEHIGTPISTESSRVIHTTDDAAWEALLQSENQDETEEEPFSSLSAAGPTAPASIQDETGNSTVRVQPTPAAKPAIKPIFPLTTEWQVIPETHMVDKVVETRFDLPTGKTYARLHPEAYPEAYTTVSPSPDKQQPPPAIEGWRIAPDGSGWRGIHADLGQTGLYMGHEGVQRAIDGGRYALSV